MRTSELFVTKKLEAFSTVMVYPHEQWGGDQFFAIFLRLLWTALNVLR